MTDKSVVGDLINFRGLVYAPINENGVILLFGRVMHDLNMYVEEVKPGFPDCIARRFTGRGWQRVAIEFEYASSNFKAHGHNCADCDIVVCWEDDWPECPIEVIELQTAIRDLKNVPIERPVQSPPGRELERKISSILAAVQAGPEVERWYRAIFDGLQTTDEAIWANVGAKLIGWYCPERSFAQVALKKRSIRIDCFSRGVALNGTKVLSARFCPRWSKFTVHAEDDVPAATEILRESYRRIKEAIKAGEATGSFSGGEPSVRPAGNGDGDPEPEDDAAPATNGQ
jgi:hypothetical protein